MKYNRVINNSEGITTQSFFTLWSNESRSLFKFNSFENEEDSAITKDGFQVTTIKSQNIDSKFELHKQLDKNLLYSYEKFSGAKEYFLVKEKLPIYNWSITNETKKILGYDCQKAITSFRGREFEVWFTSEVNIQDGPWKFYGLPGLILEVKSLDGYVTFSAYQIKLNVKNFNLPNVENDYPNVMTISFTEKQNRIKQDMEYQRKYILSQNPGVSEVKIAIEGIETDFSDLEK